MPEPISPEPLSTADTVNGWFRDRIANGAVARDTEAYNQIAEALPELIERLAPALTPTPSPPPSSK